MKQNKTKQNENGKFIYCFSPKNGRKRKLIEDLAMNIGFHN